MVVTTTTSKSPSGKTTYTTIDSSTGKFRISSKPPTPSNNSGGSTTRYVTENIYENVFDQGAYNKYAQQKQDELTANVEREKVRRQADLQAQVRRQQLAYTKRAKLSGALTQGSSEAGGDLRFRQAQQKKVGITEARIQEDIGVAEKGFTTYYTGEQVRAQKELDASKSGFYKREKVGTRTYAVTTPGVTPKPVPSAPSVDWNKVSVGQIRGAGYSSLTEYKQAVASGQTTAPIITPKPVTNLFTLSTGPSTTYVPAPYSQTQAGYDLYQASLKKTAPTLSTKSLLGGTLPSTVFTEWVASNGKNESTLQKADRLNIELMSSLLEKEKQKIVSTKPTSPLTPAITFGGTTSNVFLQGYEKYRKDYTAFTPTDELKAQTKAKQKIVDITKKGVTVGFLTASDLYIGAKAGFPSTYTSLEPKKKEITQIQETVGKIESDLTKFDTDYTTLKNVYEPKEKAYLSFLSEKDLDKSTPQAELSDTDYVIAKEMRSLLEPERQQLDTLSKKYDATQKIYSDFYDLQAKKVGEYNLAIGLQGEAFDISFSKLTPVQQATLKTFSGTFDAEDLAILPTQRATIESPLGVFGAYGEYTLMGKTAFDKKYYSKFDADVKANKFVLGGEQLIYLGKTPSSRKELLQQQRELEAFTIKKYVSGDRALENIGTIAGYTGSGVVLGGAIGLWAGPAVVIPALIGGAGGLVAGVTDVLATESLLYSTGDPLFAKTGGTVVGIGTGLLTAPLEGLAITRLATPRILGVGKARIIKSGLSLDDYIGAGLEEGITKGTGKSLSLVEIPVTIAKRKGPETIYKQFAVTVDDKFFSGVGEAVLAGGKKGTPRIINVADERIVKEASKLFYEAGTSPLTTRLAREGLFISGEREVKVFAIGQGKKVLKVDEAFGLILKPDTRVLDTPFLSELTMQGFFGKQKPLGVTGKVREFVQTKTGRLKKYKEDYFESFVTEDYLRYPAVQQGQVISSANIVKKYGDLDNLSGIGFYQTKYIPEQQFTFGSGKTVFPEGVQEVRFTSQVAEYSTESIRKSVKGIGGDVSTGWKPTIIANIDLGTKKAGTISDITPSRIAFDLKAYPRDFVQVSAEDLARFENIMGKASTTTQKVSQQTIATAKKAAAQSALDYGATPFVIPKTSFFGVQEYPTFSSYRQPRLLTQTQTVQPLTTTTFGLTTTDTMALTRELEKGLSTIAYDFPRTSTVTDYGLTTTRTLLKQRAVTKDLIGLQFGGLTKLKSQTLLKTNLGLQTRTLLKEDVALKDLLKLSAKEVLKEQVILKESLKEATRLKEALKTQTKTMTPFFPITPPPIIPLGFFLPPTKGFGDFGRGWGWNIPRHGGRTGRTKPLLRVKSDFFRKFVTGEKDLVVSAENIKLIKNIRAAKGTFLGFIPTKELLAKKRARKTKKKKVKK